MFNEWQVVKGHPSTVKKIPFAFAKLFGEEVEHNTSVVEGQLSLFDFDDEDDEPKEEIKEINIQKVYKLGDQFNEC